MAISSFGFGGSNVHAIIAGCVRPQGPPPRELPAPEPVESAEGLENGGTIIEEVQEEPLLFPPQVRAPQFPYDSSQLGHVHWKQTDDSHHEPAANNEVAKQQGRRAAGPLKAAAGKPAVLVHAAAPRVACAGVRLTDGPCMPVQMIIPVATRTQEGAQKLLDTIKRRAFMADEIALPLKK